MKYTIGTGFHYFPGSYWFWELWYNNTICFSSPKPIIVLASGGSNIPPSNPSRVEWIRMRGDIGHVYDLITGAKPYEWCGWSISIVSLALMAYYNETDFIWKEQDCLAFGEWPRQIYDEAGNRDVMFGSWRAGAANSLFWVRHSFIPEFVRLFLGTGSERIWDNIGEKKFERLEAEHPTKFGRFSFGYDRDRPLCLKQPVFYAQKLSPQELIELRAEGLIDFQGDPPQRNVFSGRL